MLRLLHKDYKGVMEMKQKLGKAIMMVVLLMGMSQTAWAEDTVVPAEKTVVTTETSSSEAVQESTEPSSTNQTESVPESSISKEDVQTVVEDVESLIKEQVGEMKEVDESSFDFNTGESIRKFLLEKNYGIDEVELSKYTDSDLMNSMVLFERYNYDITGMDMSSYVRVVRALYGDKTLSWDVISTQLSFNPSQFKSFAELVPNVNELQGYIKALYPSHSSFLPMRLVTNDELTAVLNQLEIVETKLKAENETLPAGRIIMIMNHLDNAVPANTTPSTSDSKKVDDPVASPDTKKADEKGGLLKLPQTGEEKAKWAVSILGIVLVIIVIIYVVRRKTNQNK